MKTTIFLITILLALPTWSKTHLFNLNEKVSIDWGCNVGLQYKELQYVKMTFKVDFYRFQPNQGFVYGVSSNDDSLMVTMTNIPEKCLIKE